MKLKIGDRIILLGLVPFAVSISLLSLAGFFVFGAISAERSEILAQKCEAECLAVSTKLVDGATAVVSLSGAASDSELERYTSLRRDLPQLIDRLAALSSHDRKLIGLVDDIRRRSLEFISLADELSDLESVGGRQFADLRVRELRNMVQPKAIELCKSFETFAAEQESLLSANRFGSSAYRNYFKTSLLICIASLLLATVFVVFRLTSLIKNRLEVIKENIARFLRGEQLLPPILGGDEIAEIDSLFHSVTRELKLKRRRESAAIEQSAEVICTLDKNSKLISVNHAVETRWMVQEKDILGVRLIELVAESNQRQLLADSLRKARDGEPISDLEIQIRPRKEIVIETLWTIQWSALQENYFCVCYDISDRKNLERRLALSNDRFYAVLNELPAGVLLTGGPTINFANKEAIKITGWEPAYLKTLGIDKLLAPQELAHLKKTGAIDSADSRLITNKGQITVELKAQPFSFSVPPIRGAESFNQDGPGRQKSQEQETLFIFIDTSERRQQTELKERVLGTISRDIGGPVKTVTALLEKLAGQDIPVTEKGKRTIQAAFRQSRRLERLFGDLTMARDFGAHELTCNFEKVNLADLIRCSLEAVSNNAAEKQIGLQYSGPDQAPALVDPDRIMQVIVNLAGNAIKFSPRGAVVHAVLEKQGNNAVISIIDQGEGIPQGEESLIFEPFKQSRLEDSFKKGGTGLGLTISKSIVEKHGGKIYAANNPSGGATFRLELPLDTERY